MSPERHVSRGSRVQAITRKLKERQNYEHPRSYTLKHRRTYSTNDLREKRDRFAHDRNDKGYSGQDRVVDEVKGRRDRIAHDRTTYKLTEELADVRKRTVSHVVSRLVARSLLIGFWWLLLLLWWILTLLPRCVVFVFIKDKRKHKEEPPAEKSGKKYKVSAESKVNRRNLNTSCVFHLFHQGSIPAVVRL